MMRATIFCGALFLGSMNSVLAAGNAAVAHWTFDEGKGEIAASAIPGAPAVRVEPNRWVEGIHGSALRFDAARPGLAVKYSPLFDLAGAFTIEAWVKAAGYGVIVCKTRAGGGIHFQFAITSRGAASIMTGTPIGRADRSYVTGDEDLRDGLWHHIAGVYSAKARRLQIYVDGLLRGEIANAKPIREVDKATRILLGSKTLDGAIDELRIWPRALRAEEIRASYERFADVQRAQRDRARLAAFGRLQRDWFDSDLLRCKRLVRPSLDEVRGDARFYCIARWPPLDLYGYARTRQNLRALRRIGVTDIIQLMVRGNKVYFPADHPDAIRDGARNCDPLLTLVKAAAKEHIDIWIKLQIGSNASEKMCARDRHGKPYLRRGRLLTPDVLSPAYRQFLHDMIDRFAGKYNQWGSMRGFYVDMPFANSADFFGDDIPVFEKFCRERFGESPPADIGDKIDRAGDWCDPKDKWWRRYVLFKQWTEEDFLSDLRDYCKKKGLLFAVQVNTAAASWRGWAQGHDAYRVSQLGVWAWLYPGRPCYEPCYALDNTIPGTSPYGHWGDLDTRSFRGRKAALHYFYWCWESPVLAGCTPRASRELERHILNFYEWAGARSLTRIAILNYQNGLLLRLGNNARDTETLEQKLLAALSRYCDADRLFVEATDYYPRYRVLVAPPYSVGGLSKEQMDALKAFVSNGGVVLNLGAKWSVSRRDLTNETDLTREMTGLPWRAKNAPAPAKGKRFALVEKRIGKGRVITLCAGDVMKTLASDAAAQAEFAALVKSLARPEIQIDQQGGAPVRLVTTLKKNHWVAASLCPDEPCPARVRLRVDLPRLGLRSKGYRILLLARGMELLKEPCKRGDSMSRGDLQTWWTAADLAKGVRITILPDNDQYKLLPDRIECPGLKEADRARLEKAVRYMWNRAKAHRSYEHEIAVIAPFDELTIAGEKAE